MRRVTGILTVTLIVAVLLGVVLAGGVTAPAETLDRSGPAVTPTHKFLVEIDGIALTGFASVVGLESQVAVVKYRDGTSLSTIKIPGLVKYSNIVLRGSPLQTRDLWSWYKQIVGGSIQKRNMVITLLDGAGNPTVRYSVRNAWPCAWRGPELIADAEESAYEEIELAVDNLEREVQPTRRRDEPPPR